MIFDPLRQYRNQQVIPGNLPQFVLVYIPLITAITFYHRNLFFYKFQRGAVPPGARYDPFGPVDPDDMRGSSTRIG